ncbi:hypothetical protein QG37_03519 [Candidozyma auris]|uniref:Uncharacterized protein n=1 Tax=Candidozyma auris TaxID=498019 RepID=A0A0L0NYZ9_CANAR|nr:hypothetical protein QG37_03519 [[Candida] auris]
MAVAAKRVKWAPKGPIIDVLHMLTEILQLVKI